MTIFTKSTVTINELRGYSLAYLGTPYTLYPGGIDAAYVAACKLSALLMTAGIRLFSPIAHSHGIAVHGSIDPLDHKIWLPFDQAMMEVSSTLIVAHMDGWQASFGVAHEIAYFEAANKPIFDLDPQTLLMVRRRGPLVYKPSLAHKKTRSEHGGSSV